MDYRWGNDPQDDICRVRGEMSEIALRLRIHGRVQGVSYRDWTVKTATALGLHGWVRNRLDGTVEALAIGEETQVRALMEECRKGPQLAQVERIDEVQAQGIAPRNG